MAQPVVPPMPVPPPHPVAAIFPMMSREEIARLAESIRRNGQQVPVVVFNGQLLDGRNRVAACALLGIEPKIRLLNRCDSPIETIRALNEERRHLTAVQLAAIAVDPVMLEGRKLEAETRMAAGGDRGRAIRSAGRLASSTAGGGQSNSERTSNEAVALSAKALGVGRAAAYTMQRIQRTAPDVYESARRGEIPSVKEAAKLAGVPYDRPIAQPAAPVPVAPAEPETNRDPRVVRREARDEEIRALHESEGIGTKEIAKRLGVAPATVIDAKSRMGLNPKPDGNPLRRLTDYAIEFSDTFDLAIGNPSQWAGASPEQIDALVGHLRALRSKTHTLIQKLSGK